MTKNQVEPLFYARERVKGGIKALAKQREGSLDWGSNVTSCPDREEVCKVTRGGDVEEGATIYLSSIDLFIFMIVIFYCQ